MGKYLLLFLYSTLALGKSCPEASGKYGEGIQYQSFACRFFITADTINSNVNRNITLNDDGLIQVFSNFPGTNNSNSTGARVFYLFPIRVQKTLDEIDKNHLALTHPSGVRFDFDRNGRLSSPDLEMTMSKEINAKNNSGVEIKKYNNGLIVDIGYAAGTTPITDKNRTITVTDKNLKKCNFSNSLFHKISKYDAEVIYKTNLDLHHFLAKQCPNLDISDLIADSAASIKKVTRPSDLGSAVKSGDDLNNNSARSTGSKNTDSERSNEINSEKVFKN